VKEILRENPDFDINWRNEQEGGCTALVRACERGHAAVVSVLLAHPSVDVNLKDRYGRSPLASACHLGDISCARLLLNDSRVKVNEPDFDGRIALWLATYGKYLDIIKWWIVSGREMNLSDAMGDTIRTTWEWEKTEIVILLQRFEKNPVETRHAMRLELDWYSGAAAGMFALVVFVSDDLLQITATTPTPAARFFEIVRQLPLELQMVLCHRLVGSTMEIIPARICEEAFQSLAESLL